jgi:hypothetical protein
VPDWVASTGQGQSVEVILYNDSSSTVCCRTPLTPTPRGAPNYRYTVYCVNHRTMCARANSRSQAIHMSQWPCLWAECRTNVVAHTHTQTRAESTLCARLRPAR